MQQLPWNKELLNLAAWRFSKDTLGPGNRLCIWVQGCLKNCPGCMAKDWRSMREANMISPADFYRTISDTPVDGVTISGGEPFLQSHALACLLKIMHPRNVICFSGYTYEEILQDASKRDLLNVTDILIDGEYDENKNSGSGLRGSYNQKIIQLKNPASGEKQLSAAQLETCPRKMEIITEKDGIMIVGIPEKRLWKSLYAIYSGK